MAVMSALHAGRPLPPRKFLVLIFVSDWVDPRATVRLEGLGKLKKKKIHWPHRESNWPLSGLQHSASTNYATDAAPYLKRLVADFPPRRAGFSPGSGKWDLWSRKWRRNRFSPSTSVSPAKTVHSTNFSFLTIPRGRYNRPGVTAVPIGPSMDSTPKY
jgi:hypothetical protein